MNHQALTPEHGLHPHDMKTKEVLRGNLLRSMDRVTLPENIKKEKQGTKMNFWRTQYG